MFDYKEIIEKMKKQGILFEQIDEENAIKYISERTNFFRIYAYRKNFHKLENKGYNVDFQAFADLGTCDLLLRELLFKMALSAEYMLKIKLLNEIKTKTQEDCYQIVEDFLKTQKITKEHFLEKWKKNPYVAPLLLDEENTLPLWLFLEFIPFNKFLKFCAFYQSKYPQSEVLNEDTRFLLHSITNIRNACAHNNCLLLDLYAHPKSLPGTSQRFCQMYAIDAKEIAYLKPLDFFHFFIFFNQVSTKIVKTYRKKDLEQFLTYIKNKNWLKQSTDLIRFISFLEEITTKIIDTVTYL